MTLTDLINMTRVYTRDNNAFMFKDAVIIMFLNQAIDRIRQYPTFADMPYLAKRTDVVEYLPMAYHYLLALFASARCYDTDERFYEGTEKRNEFEFYFNNLINDIESGNVAIVDSNGVAVDNSYNATEYVVDEYFKGGLKIE